MVLFTRFLFHLMCRILIPGDYAETVCGTPLYMAPEMLGFQRYDHKVRIILASTLLQKGCKGLRKASYFTLG